MYIQCHPCILNKISSKLVRTMGLCMCDVSVNGQSLMYLCNILSLYGFQLSCSIIIKISPSDKVFTTFVQKTE